MLRQLSDELGRPMEPHLDVFFMKGRDQDVESNECTFIRKDGSRFDVSLTMTTLRGAEGWWSGFPWGCPRTLPRANRPSAREDAVHSKACRITARAPHLLSSTA